jgi:hypothetical protein
LGHAGLRNPFTENPRVYSFDAPGVNKHFRLDKLGSIPPLATS